jgi:hypothetical protein
MQPVARGVVRGGSAIVGRTPDLTVADFRLTSVCDPVTITDMVNPASAHVQRVLLVAAVTGLCGTVLFSVAWYRAVARRLPPVESLGEEARRQLTNELVAASPGIFQPALTNPLIGYTLKPNQRVEAWNDVFFANSLGYRAGFVEKRPGTCRVVFVGDSWTFGLGVSEAKAFPRQLEGLARRHGAHDVEAWSLALPGYNLLNEVAALETFADLLQPDAVVFCPTINDINSTQVVLPNGSLGHAGQLVDDFGSPVALELRSRIFDSHLFKERWRRVMSELARAERRLEARAVPSVVLFTGPWIASLAHRLAADAGLRSPYIVMPPALVGQRWLNPPPWRHPNPEAHLVYARMVYRALAPLLGWTELTESGEDADVPVHKGGSAGDWQRESDEALREQTARLLSFDFVPARRFRAQLGCGIDPRIGAMGRSGAVFLRRQPGSRTLMLELKRVVDDSSIYPLGLTVIIPSPSSGVTRRPTVAADGPPRQRFSVELPSDLGSATAIDVLIEADRVGVDSSGVVPWSVVVVRVWQEP